MDVVFVVVIVEIRGGVSIESAVERSTFAIRQQVALRLPECITPSREYLDTGHLLHNAW